MKPPMSSVTVRSKAVVLLLLIHCFRLLSLFFVKCKSLFGYTVLSGLNRFAIISLRKSELIALL